MSLTDTGENDVLKLLFWGTTWAAGAFNIAQNAVSAPVTQYFLSFHTADPAEAGTQAASETAYTGYGATRTAMVRSSATGGFSIPGFGGSGTASPNGHIDAPACTAGGPGTHPNLTHFGIGTSATVGAAGYLVISGALTPAIQVQSGVTPRLSLQTVITAD